MNSPLMRHLLTALLILPTLALGQGSLALSLGEAEKLWREHSRELQLADIAVAGAEADLSTARQIPNPEVSLNLLSISPWTGWGSGPWSDKKMDNILRIDQLVERGNKRELRSRGAEERLAATRFEAADTGRQQLADLQRAYFGLKLAQEKLALAGETAALYGKGTAAGQRRLKAGDIAPVDVARLSVDQGRAEGDARQAQGDLEQAQQILAYLIGRETDAAQLAASDPWPAPDAREPVAAAAIDKRPDIAALRRRLAAAEAERDLARARRTRDVTVGFQYEHNLQNAPTNSIGVGVSMPLFIWHEYEGEIARAESEVNAARLQLEQLRARALGQAERARSALQAARDRLQRLESGLLADAERVATAAEFAYNKGAMGLMDLLDARRTLRQIRIEATNARADYAVARADWLAALGE
jgi:cobalt-zinc-cadmium efflux system outer membrane protein